MFGNVSNVEKNNFMSLLRYILDAKVGKKIGKGRMSVFPEIMKDIEGRTFRELKKLA